MFQIGIVSSRKPAVTMPLTEVISVTLLQFKGSRGRTKYIPQLLHDDAFNVIL